MSHDPRAVIAQPSRGARDAPSSTLAVAAALCIASTMLALPTRSQAAATYSDGTISSVNGYCPVTGTTAIAASSYVGYYTDPAVTYPATGDVAFVHIVAANVIPCFFNDTILLELGLPYGATWAISSANPVRCFQGNVGGGSWEVTNNAAANSASCLQTPVAGANGGASFGGSALAPGTYYEIRAPVKFEAPLPALGQNGKLTGGATSGYGTMFSSQTVNVAYRPSSYGLAVSQLTASSAYLSSDLLSYFTGGTLYVDYGKTAGLGSSVFAFNVPATDVGFTGIGVGLSGLGAGTHYYWRTRFVTSQGTFTSTLQSFNTPGSGGSMGEPHMTTVDGTHYDFQGVGEFVWLRDQSLELQARNTAIATEGPTGVDPYTGLSSCVSATTAVAMRVGKQRISYQPSGSAREGLQLRVNGLPVNVQGGPIALAEGARIERTAAPGGVAIKIPNGATVIITPGFLEFAQLWLLNVEVRNTIASSGLLGTVEQGSWLPATPDGTSLGAQPSDLRQRHDAVYTKLGNAWRLSDADSLFDYLPGTSTQTYTLADWPLPGAKTCKVPGQRTTRRPNRMALETAQQLCSRLTGAERRADCAADLVTMGDASLADTYLFTEQVAAQLASQL